MPAVRNAKSARTNRKAVMDVDTLWSIKRITSPTLSPDASLACATVTSYSMADNNSKSSLWLFTTNGASAKELTSAGEKDGSAQWSPNGKTIAFIAKRAGDEAAQIYTIDPLGGEAHRITQLSTSVFGIKWFSDSKKIAFLSWVWPDLKSDKEQAAKLKAIKDNPVKAQVIEHDHYRHWDHWISDGRMVQVHVLDIASKKVTNLMQGTQYGLPRQDPSAAMYDVSPDGRQLCFQFNPNGFDRSDVAMQLITLDVRAKKFTQLSDANGFSYDAPRYSPDGKQIAYIAMHHDKNDLDQNKLFVRQRKTGLTQQWIKGWDREVNADLTWSADSTTILFTAEDQGQQHLWSANASSKKIPARLIAGGTVSEFSTQSAGVCFIRHDASTPPKLYAASLDGSQISSVESINDELLAGLTLGLVQSQWYDGADGEPVQVWITYPPNFDPKKKYPLLQNIHGGPHTCFADTWHFRWNTQAFAAQGYVVACVQYHGSTSYGQSFKQSIRKEWGKREAIDIENCTDHLINQGFIDPKRLVAAGGSYGGYMVGMLNGRAHIKGNTADRYKAYICHAGCFDWVGMFADDAYFYFWRQLGAYYYNDMARIMVQSPHAYADRFSTPTLVMHGELDYRVPVSQGFAYYNTLRAQKIDSRLVYFPDENHWILKPQNSKLWYREFFDWFKRYL
jgi:dipeptidyl aminopeptidase/acylaminoacyl peptidase